MLVSYPPSYGQQSQWYVHQVRRATEVYVDLAVFELSGHLDSQALQTAVAMVVQRHEVLRTRFVEVEGQLQQVVDESWLGQVEFERASAGKISSDDIASYTERQAGLEFDLAKGPLFRVGVLSADDDHHVVAFVKHRMIMDCWSLGLLLEEIGEYYSALLASEDVRRPAVAQTYGEFARWQTSDDRYAEFIDLLEYWVHHVGDAPRELRLGGYDPVPVSGAGRAQERHFHLPRAVADRLQEFAQSCGATLYMALLAAFETVVGMSTGASDFLIGVPVAGRTQIEHEESVGYFVNLLALRADLRDDPTGAGLVRRVRKTMLGGMAHQDLPFEVLLSELGVRPSPERHPLVQVTMQLIEGASTSDLQLPGLEVTPVPVDEYQIAFAVSLNLYTGDDGIRGRLIYTVGEVDEGIAEVLLERFCQVVELLPLNPDSTVAEITEICEREASHRPSSESG